MKLALLIKGHGKVRVKIVSHEKPQSDFIFFPHHVSHLLVGRHLRAFLRNRSLDYTWAK